MSDLHTLTIYGASDDCVEVGGYITEEFYALNEPALLMIIAPDGAHVAVEAEWCPQGPLREFCEGWRITVHHIDVDWDYPVRLGDLAGDPAVALDVPEGTTVTRLGGDR